MADWIIVPTIPYFPFPGNIYPTGARYIVLSFDMLRFMRRLQRRCKQGLESACIVLLLPFS